MASTFTTSFGIEKIGTGEQAGAWGTTTNHNADILDRIASYKAVGLSGTTHTLTVREASPGAGTENLQDGMYRVIKFTGALGANNTVTIAPNTSSAWFIFENATTDSGSSGPYSVILSQGSGANITLQNGKNAIVYCDGAGSGAAVFNALNDLQMATLEVTGAGAVDGALTVGGTTTAVAITASGLVTAGAKIDMNGTELILDADADTSITADTDDTIDIRIAGADDFQFTANTFTAQSGSTIAAQALTATTVTASAIVTANASIDLNGTELILDADADTSITADTDDQIDFKIGGTDKLTLTAAKASLLDVIASLTPTAGDVLSFPTPTTAAGRSIPGRNLIINGAISVAQRGTSFTSYGATNNAYSLDQYKIPVAGSASARWTVTQESSGGVSGNAKWLKALVTTADTPGAAEGQAIIQRPEGQSIQALRRDGGGTKAATYSFDVIVHADGGSGLSFPVSLPVVFLIHDNVTDREIVSDVSVAAADTWERVTVSFPEDTSGGGPVNTSSAGSSVGITLAAGSNYVITADTWQNSTNLTLKTSSSDNFADATNNYVGFTEVQLEVGSVATDFEHEDIGTTLDKCLRYFERRTWLSGSTIPYYATISASTSLWAMGSFLVEKRAAPTITFTGAVNNDLSGGGNSTSETFSAITTSGFRFTAGGFVGLTVAGACMLGPAGATATLDASAEL